MVGRGKAVCEVRGHRISGLIAFLMYIAVHLFYLGGVGGRRIGVGLTMLGSLFGARQSRVMEGELTRVERLQRPVTADLPPAQPASTAS